MEEELKIKETVENDNMPYYKKTRESVLVTTFSEIMTPEIKRKNIEEFYNEEEKEFQDNLKILETLNSKLSNLNKENNNDIQNLEAFLEDYKAKNLNLIANNQKILSEIEQNEMTEKQMQEKLKELEKVLEMQENQKFLHENKVKNLKFFYNLSKKIKELEKNYEKGYRAIIELQQEKE